MLVLVGVSTRALLESAVDCGYQAMAIDYFGDQDARWRGPVLSLADLGLKPLVGNLFQAAADNARGCSGLVYAAGPENHPQGLAVWAKRGLLLGNGPETLARVRNPWLLRDALAAIGSAMPPFCAVSEWGDSIPGPGWIVKPVSGGGGRGIRRLATGQAGAAQLAAVSDPQRYLVQRFIPGVAASVTFIADGRRAAVVGTSRQLTAGDGLGGGRFAYAGSIVPLAWQTAGGAADPGPELARIAGHLTAVFGLRGINTLDFIINRQGVWVLEVNPRWSASVELIERWRGERLFARHVAACGPAGTEVVAGERVEDRPGGFWGKAVVYARTSLQTVVAEREARAFYRSGLRDIPAYGSVITAGQPLCSVLAWGGTIAACRRALLAKAAWARRILGDIPAAGTAAGAGQPRRAARNR